MVTADEDQGVWVCPECSQDKHLACNGDAWNMDTDRPTVCTCWSFDHDLSDLYS